MTERLYYEDPYQVRFSARVVERLVVGERPAVVLDRSAFYPTGGGQPHDTGVLLPQPGPECTGVAVVDVIEREGDRAVVHLLKGALPSEATAVEGVVDWRRRLDLMQQHTGQHILSAVCVRRLGANTVGFHLSDEYSTIDLDRASLSDADLEPVEEEANAAVFADRSVRARFVTDEELRALPLRKPAVHAGRVRVVEVPDLDLSACGGTHVARTGQVGLLKILRTERRGEETRVEFVCGGRALADFRAKHRLLLDLARQRSVGWWELGEALDRQEQELKGLRRELRATRDALLDAEAARLWAEGEVHGPMRLVVAAIQHLAAEDVKHLVPRLVARPHTAALLGWSDEDKAQLTFGRSDDLPFHMGRLMGLACAQIGGRGGGRPEFAQGGGPHPDRLRDALDAAREGLIAGAVA
jgi:alanyl-tRNA synthetase